MKKVILFFVCIFSFCSIVNADSCESNYVEPKFCESYQIRRSATCGGSNIESNNNNCVIDKGSWVSSTQDIYTPKVMSTCSIPIPHCPDPDKIRIVFLIDDSYSMRKQPSGVTSYPRIAAVKLSIQKLLEKYKADGYGAAKIRVKYFTQPAGHYVYNADNTVSYLADHPNVVLNKIKVGDFGDGGKNTNFDQALNWAKSYADKYPAITPYIVFITDGYPNAGAGKHDDIGWLSSARYFYTAAVKMKALSDSLKRSAIANGQLITVGIDLGADDAMANFFMNPTEANKTALTSGNYRSNESNAFSLMLDGSSPDINGNGETDNKVEPANQRFELVAGIGAHPEAGIVGYHHFNASGKKIVLFNNLYPLSGNSLGNLFIGPVIGEKDATKYQVCTNKVYTKSNGDEYRKCVTGVEVKDVAEATDGAFFVKFNADEDFLKNKISDNSGWLFMSSSTDAWSFRTYSKSTAVNLVTTGPYLDSTVYQYYHLKATSAANPGNPEFIGQPGKPWVTPKTTYTFENKKCCINGNSVRRDIDTYTDMCVAHNIELKTLNNNNYVHYGSTNVDGFVDYILTEHIGFNGGSLMTSQTAVPGSGFSMKNLYFYRGFDIDFAVEGGPYGSSTVNPAVKIKNVGQSNDMYHYVDYNSITEFRGYNRNGFKRLIKEHITENFDVGFDDVKTVDSNDASNLNYVINDHLEKEENAVSTTHYYDFSKSRSARNYGSSIKPAYALLTNADIADVRHSSALGGWLCSRTYNNVHKSSTYLEFNDIDSGRGSYSGPDYKYGFAILDMHKHGDCSAPTTSYYPTGSSDSHYPTGSSDSHYPIDYYYETLEVKFSMDMLSRESIGGSSAAIDDDPSGKKDFIIGNWETYGGGIYLNDGEIRANLYIEDGVDNGYKVISSGIKAEVRRMYTVRLEYYGEKMLLYINGKKAGELVVRGKIRQPNGRDLEGHYVSGRVTSMALGCNPKGDGCSPTVPFARMRVHSVMISGVSDRRESPITYTTRSDVYRIKTAHYDANAGNKNGLFCYGSTCGSSYKEVSPNFYNYYYVPFNYKSDQSKIFISASSVATGQKVSTECMVNVEGEISNPTKKVNYRSVNVSEPFPRQTSNYREVPYNWYLYYYCNNIINDVNGCKSFNGAARDRIKSSYDQSKKHYTINLGKDDLSGMSNFNFFYKSDIKLYDNGSSKFISGNPMFTQPSGNDKYCEIGRWSSDCDRY